MDPEKTRTGEPGDDQRRTYRHPVEVCRPIGLQLLNDALEPVTAWLLADILDISLGGLCLLITDSTDHHFAPRHRVRVNVTAHPPSASATCSGSCAGSSSPTT